MAMYVSTGLTKLLSEGKNLEDILSPFFMKIYGGDIPKDADSGLEENTLLCTFTRNGDGEIGLTIIRDDNYPNMQEDRIYVTKELDESWEGITGDSMLATFFRIIKANDTGLPSKDEIRIQGGIGTIMSEKELRMVNPILPPETPIRVDHFRIDIPKH